MAEVLFLCSYTFGFLPLPLLASILPLIHTYIHTRALTCAAKEPPSKEYIRGEKKRPVKKKNQINFAFQCCVSSKPQKCFESAENKMWITVYPLAMFYLLPRREAGTLTGVLPTLLWLCQLSLLGKSPYVFPGNI